MKTADGSPLALYEEGRKLADIHDDGPLNTGPGHGPETLHAFCRASALGNAAADYEIAMLMQTGYRVYALEASGRATVIRDQPPDLLAAVYWWEKAANAGFTKAMPALATAYGLGPDFPTPGANKIPLDRRKSADWLTRAADAGDTYVLLTLVRNAVHLPVPPWMMELRLPSDKDPVMETYRLALRKTIADHEKECAGAAPQATAFLPTTARDRVVSYSVEAVHGTSATKPTETDCLLHLSLPPDRPQGNIFDQTALPLDGSEVTTWRYSLVHLPSVTRSSLHVDTTRDAVEEMFLDTMTQIKIVLDGAR